MVPKAFRPALMGRLVAKLHRLRLRRSLRENAIRNVIRYLKPYRITLQSNGHRLTVWWR